MVLYARSCSGSPEYDATLADPLLSPRVALAAILHACFGSPSSTGQLQPPRPLRIISPTGSYNQPIFRLIAAYSATTQVPVNYITLPLLEYSVKRQSMLLNAEPPTNSTGYDALVASATAYGDAAQVPGKLLDLSYLVVNDPVVDWQDIPAGLRASMTMLDIFQRDNLTVPQTWEQFADLAERYHNGPDGLVGACIMPIGCRGESLMLRTIYASYVQTQGHSQGVDPETMQPLVNSPAMEAALRVFRRLYAVGLNTSNAPACTMPEFNEGKCLMSIAPGSRFKEANIGAPNVTVVRGRIGIAPLPGSTRVLDRSSMALVRCDKQICPLADGEVEEDGQMVPVNRPSTLASAIILINGLSPLQYQFFAYQLFALLTALRITDAQTVLLENNGA
ncbi:hypothetical protein HXX76_007313 [Chlamydomonas incerta]|uniref:Uncharacterized protein n=1 Tax=Chlamydomonas incerta TaxID=51695 RepID=A0A835SY19_CHLIN|nr:hypothetical protein HXX76_007313 [Chlamydomonas incerta]|eukprot:KAG2435233.1 hypothetical protein HXX76_007313 [Chlamydomonas incerta]